MLLKECWFCCVLEEARQSAWDNIVTCHHGDKQARTWSFQRKCIGAHHLKSHAADDKAGPVMVCRLPVFCYRNNKMIRLQRFSIACGLLHCKFKGRPPNVFFATDNPMFAGSSQRTTTAEQLFGCLNCAQ